MPKPVGDYLEVYAEMQRQAAIDVAEVQQWTSRCMRAQVPYTMTIEQFERLHVAESIEVKMV